MFYFQFNFMRSHIKKETVVLGIDWDFSLNNTIASRNTNVNYNFAN